MPRNTAPKADLYQRVTDQIIAALESGVKPWSKTWRGGSMGLPLRVNGIPYRGINVLLLFMAAQANGYGSRFWMTYKAASELGGQVRKGERGTTVTYSDKITRTEENASGEEEKKDIFFLKAYTVFNCDQIDGLPAKFYRAEQPEAVQIDPIPEAEAFFANTKADIRHEGSQPCYIPSQDFIRMPQLSDFFSAEAYYATAAHEAVHNAAVRIMPRSHPCSAVVTG